MSSQARKITTTDLWRMRQLGSEPLRRFAQRFSLAMNEISGLSVDTAVMAMLQATANMSLKSSLSKNPPTSFEEFSTRL